MKIVTVVTMIIFLGSCVSTRKFNDQASQLSREKSAHAVTQQNLTNCENRVKDGEMKIADLQSKLTVSSNRVSALKENNDQTLKQLENLSVITNSQAESIKKSMENIGAQNQMIYSLQASLAQRDSLNMALVMNLKGVLDNINDQDINVKVVKGVVYIDISDKMLFNSGSYEITERAGEVLGKVARVLNNQKDIEFMVVGHTDNVPFRRGDLLDNWDLSVKRSTAVIRVLQNRYGLSAAKMTAAGQSEYQPVATNETADGRSLNRRTTIMILPQLDQFFKLLERPKK